MIAIDIETTGLNPKEDKITEIAGVRFEGNVVLDEFQSLVNPNRPIPQNVIHLTHITNDMVRGAPQVLEVIEKFGAFVGREPVVGHNIAFDLSFLRQGGILRGNPAYDTYALASVLIPDAPRYNLAALAQQLEIPVSTAHRALADCQTTFRVFNKLIERAYDLPLTLLMVLIRLGDRIGWNEATLLNQVAAARIKAGEKTGKRYVIPFPSFDDTFSSDIPILEPNEITLPLDVNEAASLIESGGALNRGIDHFETRPQQIEMLHAVANGFTRGHHQLIEAGTGTGKSFAYLIPAAKWALLNGERVVISTNTINLQDQLIQKDIPALKRMLDEEIRAVVLKGKINFLCPRNVLRLQTRGADAPDEFRVLAKILVWLSQGGTGDRGGITLIGPCERDIWRKLSAETEGCRPKVCPFFRDHRCAYFARQAEALRAHLIVVNHSLLLSDMAIGNRILPDYRYLIIDEGHHLENAATNAFSKRLTKFDLLRLENEIGGPNSGALGRLLIALLNRTTPDQSADFAEKVQTASETAAKLKLRIQTLFDVFDEYLRNERDGAELTVYGQQQRLTPASRTASNWTNVEIVWDETESVFREWLSELKKIHQALEDLGETDDDLAEISDILNELTRNIDEAKSLLEELIMKPKPDYIYWLEITAVQNYLSLNAAPLQVGDMIDRFFWMEKECVILTSATLTADNSFDYIRDRLGAREAEELVVGSPFDYEKSVLLYLPTDIPEPNQGAAQHMVETSITRLAQATHGRMLVLFTSYAQLKRTSSALTAALKTEGFSIFEQGEGASPTALLETFRKSEKAILLGTRSFWEGVDIQGEKLSCVVIVKLPFDVPSDPIIAARSESFDNPFAQYSLPEAILKFRQGFGRLIRASGDRGIVAVLDSRLLTKRYGQDFINSIPRCTEKRGSIRDLARESAAWLQKK